MIHGIWMKGLEMSLLGRRLSAKGFDIHYFRYKSLTKSPQANARKLAEFIQRLDAETVHLVAHSLGGLVLLHLFDLFPGQPPGRVVLLGSPVQGSGVARKMAESDWLKPLLGRSLERGLLGDLPPWKADRELGVIAGTSNMGIGRIFGGLQGESDGTVAVGETHLPGAKAFCSLNVGHMGLLFSGEVARAAAGFIRQGNFQDGDGKLPAN